MVPPTRVLRFRIDSRQGAVWSLSLLLVTAGLFGPVPARAWEPDPADLLGQGLLGPLAAEREAAEARVAAAGPAGRALALRWTLSAEPARRSAGWRVVRRRIAWADPVAARAGLADRDGQTAIEAARVLVELGRTPGLAPSPILPAGCLHAPIADLDAARRDHALAFALAEVIERTPEGRVPDVGLFLGEGTLGALVQIVKQGHHPSRVRVLAAGEIARFGTVGAAEALVALTRDGVLQDCGAVYPALMEVRLDEDARRVLYANLKQAGIDVSSDWRRGGSKWRAFFVGRRGGWAAWQERMQLRRLVRVHPPVEDVDALARYYRERLSSRRRPARDGVDAVAGLIALGDVQAADMHLIVGSCFETLSWHPRWRGRAEELGSILVSLSALPDLRAPLQEALLELFEFHELDTDSADATQTNRDGPLAGGAEPLLWRTDLPRSVEAWGRYLLGRRRPGAARRVGLERMATELIRGDGEMPTWAARRLGARLWGRLGDPPVALVRTLLGDPDEWMRRQALAWIDQLPEAERHAALLRAIRDPVDDVFLVAVGQLSGPRSRSDLERLVRLAVSGKRGQRIQALGAVSRGAAEATPRAGLPSGEPGLDQRLRLVTAFRARFPLGKDLPGSASR